MSKIGDVIVKLLLKSDEYESGLKRSKKATQDFASTITKGFSAAIGKVTALIGVVVGIAKAFEQVSSANQTFGDKWNLFTAGLRSSWEEFAVSIASLDFSHLIRRMREASDVARDLANSVDAMGEINAAYEIASSEEQTHLEELRLAANDQTKSLQERKDAADEYVRIVKELRDMPLFGLGNVKNDTLDKYLTRMGVKIKLLNEEQLAATRKQYVEFFRWLGTQKGITALSRVQDADVASGEAARVAQNLMSQGVSRQYVTWLKTYAAKMNDVALGEIRSAIVDYNQAVAASLSDTRRMQTLANSLQAQMDKPTGGAGSSVTTFPVAIKKAADLLGVSAQEYTAELEKFVADIEAVLARKDLMELDEIAEPLKNVPAIISGAVVNKMPDIISDDWLERQRAKGEEFNAFIRDMASKSAESAEMLASAVKSGILNSIDMLTEAIGSGENIDGGAMVKALLSPLADACITAGMLIMTTGEGVEALRDTLLTGLATGGISAIAAGAALMAVGAAAKIGLAAITSSKSAGASAVSTYSAGSAAQGTQQIESEITVVVEGRISGSDIVLSGQNTLNSWNR